MLHYITIYYDTISYHNMLMYIVLHYYNVSTSAILHCIIGCTGATACAASSTGTAASPPSCPRRHIEIVDVKEK